MVTGRKFLQEDSGSEIGVLIRDFWPSRTLKENTP